VRYYLERRDPNFDERKAEVLEVYAAAHTLRNLPEAERPVAVVSYDEKPGIQAIAATAPDLPPRPDQHATGLLMHSGESAQLLLMPRRRLVKAMRSACDVCSATRLLLHSRRSARRCPRESCFYTREDQRSCRRCRAKPSKPPFCGFVAGRVNWSKRYG
jgi:hypothetical protein